MKRFNLAFRDNYEGNLANGFLETLGPKNRWKTEFIACCITDYLLSLGISDVSNMTQEQASQIVMRKIRNDRNPETLMLILSELLLNQGFSKNNAGTNANNSDNNETNTKENNEEQVYQTDIGESLEDLDDDIEENEGDDELLSMLEGF